MPPVELYEIGDAYCGDGHHRVSVARYHDVPTLEAAVAEFYPGARRTDTRDFEERGTG